MPKYTYDDKNVNFARIGYVILQYGKKALMEGLEFVINRDCPTLPTLQQVLAAPGVKTALYSVHHGLTRPQKDLLYPGGLPSTTIKNDDLDITLASFLLRNVPLFTGNQPPTATAWSSPTAHDLTTFPLESNIYLLRDKRNELQAHLKKPKLKNRDFQVKFDDVKKIVVNIMNAVGSTIFDSNDIERIRTNPMSSEIVYNILDDFEKLNLLENIQKNVNETRNTVSRNFLLSILCVILLLFLVILLFYYGVFTQTQSISSNNSHQWSNLYWFVDNTIEKMHLNQGEQMRNLIMQLNERDVTLHKKMLICVYFPAILVMLMACFGQGYLQRVFQLLQRFYSGNKDDLEPHLREVTKYFTGRNEETLEISRLVVECKTRLINIVGPPGFGKTTVALQVGHHLRDNGYKVAFVGIQRNSTIEQIAASFLEAFGVEIGIATEVGCSRANQMFNHMESLKQKTIIIFDNAEDAFTISKGIELNNCATRRREFSDMLAEIFERNRLVSIVLTSRQRFLLAHPVVRVDEKEVEITALSEESSAELLMKVAPSLNEESAFTLGNLIGGVPLLLENTAGVIESAHLSGYLTAEEIIEDIRRKENVLSAYRVDEQERMFHLIDISYSKLPKILQNLWKTISLFPESCDREAVEEILEIETIDAKIHLSELIERYLLYYNSPNERYYMHRVMQNFGNMKRSNDPRKDHETLQKFCQHFLKRITDFCRNFTVENKTDSLLKFSSDYANYRKLFLSSFRDTELCGETIFVTFLETSISFRMWLGANDVKELVEEAIESVMKCGKFSGIRALCFDSDSNSLSHDKIVGIPAKDIVSEATIIIEGVDSSNSILTAYLYLIFCLAYVDNSESIGMDQVVELEVLIHRALEIFELQLDDKLGMARAYSLKGRIYKKVENFPEAIEQYKNAIELYQSLPGGLHIEAAHLFQRIGNMYQKMNSDPELQIEYFEKAAQVFTVNVKEPKNDVDKHLPSDDDHGGDSATSQSTMEKHQTSQLSSFLRECVQRQADKARAECIFEKGYTCMRNNDNERALAYFFEALEIQEKKVGKHRRMSDSLDGIARCLCDMGKYLEALPYAQQCLELRLTKGVMRIVRHRETAFAYELVGDINSVLNNFTEAYWNYQEGFQILCEYERYGREHEKTKEIENKMVSMWQVIGGDKFEELEYLETVKKVAQEQRHDLFLRVKRELTQ